MKTASNIALSVLVLCTISGHAYSQDSGFVKSTFKGDITKHFMRNLSFPPSLALAGITGFGVAEFRINKSGHIDSIHVIAPHPKLAQNIVETLASVNRSWRPTKSNGKKINFMYTLVVQYLVTDGQLTLEIDPSIKLYDKALKEYKNKKSEEGLLSVNEALAYNPHKPEYYKLRYELLLSLGKIEESEKDRLTFERLERQQLDIVTITASGPKR